MSTPLYQMNGRPALERPAPYQPRMPRLNRAKLFAPYDALKPFEATVHAKDSVFVHRIELSDYAQECLDRRLQQLKRGDLITVTWFQRADPDSDLDRGQYVSNTGSLTRIDKICRVIFLGKLSIQFQDILNLRGENEDATCEGGTALP